MKFLLTLVAATLFALPILPQSAIPLRLILLDRATGTPIVEAVITVIGTGISVKTDSAGKAELIGVPNGKYDVEFFSPGYRTETLGFSFPFSYPDSLRTVFLDVENEVGEVTVTSTRTGREIEAEPTRVEAIDEEEVDEKINMRPANVSMVLNESTGIQVQQTSAVSNTQTVSIQGLDGRYTQILKDGFPAYGGFSGSLSVLEIPPLDLKQVEIIKGPSATLFGGDAIAGVVNFVSKTPEERPVTTLLFNQTSALGTDVSAYHSRNFGQIGFTLLGSFNYQNEYDVDDDDFTELPLTKYFTVNPRFFFSFGDSKLTIGNSIGIQDRRGGDVFAVRGMTDPLHPYFEANRSVRNVTTFNFEHELADGGRLFAKQSVAAFSRRIATPGYEFRGNQTNSFTDISYLRSFGKHAMVFGGSAVYDKFNETTRGLGLNRDEKRFYGGAFVQDTFDVNSRLSVEAGFRLDHAKDYGTFALPRVSVLYRFSDNFTSRVGFGLGYKTPTMFTEDAEELLFRNVTGIGNSLKAERSRGGTLDFNYRGNVGERFGYSFNQMFFYTTITDPIILRDQPNGTFRFSNAASPVISRGAETNARLSYGIAKVFVGYTFTDAHAGYLAGTRLLTLLSRHRVNSSLVFEEHESFKAGVEFYYGSRQTLDDRSFTRSIAEVGIFAEKTFGKFSLFINGENLTDVRQSKYTPVVLGPHANPRFAEVYTHLEGRVFNGGIKVRF